MLAAPHFVSFLTPTSVDAAHETEALLDHYLHHANTPPFIAHRYIQRFVSSNPSPRYVLAVATAFRTGEYDGVVYGGGYGDLAATIAAVLLDREARSMALDADPHHGVLREPLLKVHHFLRAMEFLPAGGRGEVQLPNIEDDIGMNAHKSPSVFNFYQPEYQPAGPIARAGLVAPEGGLATAPYLIGYLNGMLLIACSLNIITHVNKLCFISIQLTLLLLWIIFHLYKLKQTFEESIEINEQMKNINEFYNSE